MKQLNEKRLQKVLQSKGLTIIGYDPVVVSNGLDIEYIDAISSEMIDNEIVNVFSKATVSRVIQRLTGAY